MSLAGGHRAGFQLLAGAPAGPVNGPQNQLRSVCAASGCRRPDGDPACTCHGPGVYLRGGPGTRQRTDPCVPAGPALMPQPCPGRYARDPRRWRPSGLHQPRRSPARGTPGRSPQGRSGGEPSACAFARLSRCVEPSAGGLAGRSAAMINYVPADEQTWRKHGRKTATNQAKEIVKRPGHYGRVRSSRLGLTWGNGAWLEGCPQVKRALPTLSGCRRSGSGGWAGRSC
jgi:hypothetical protein